MSYDRDDCEPVTLYNERIQRARKTYPCHACEAMIRPGDLYCYVFSVFEGEPTKVRRCGRCQKTYEHLCELGRENGMVPDWTLSCGLDYKDEWGDVPPDIARLPFLTDDEASALLAKEPKP